jgi:hypothetical protein
MALSSSAHCARVAAEVGNQRGREALLSSEKVFGRVQSARTPAQGIETFEIIRRRVPRKAKASIASCATPL